MRIYHYGELNNGALRPVSEIRNCGAYNKPYGPGVLYASRATGPNSWAAFCRREYGCGTDGPRWRLTVDRARARVLTLASTDDWDNFRATYEGHIDWDAVARDYDMVHVRDWRTVNATFRWDCETFIIFNVAIVIEVEKV
jgi:hypothetical protein